MLLSSIWPTITYITAWPKSPSPPSSRARRSERGPMNLLPELTKSRRQDIPLQARVTRCRRVISTSCHSLAGTCCRWGLQWQLQSQRMAALQQLQLSRQALWMEKEICNQPPSLVLRSCGPLLTSGHPMGLSAADSAARPSTC